MLHPTTIVYSREPRAACLRVSALLVLASLAALLASPHAAHAAVAQTAFPRVAFWYCSTESAANQAKYDYCALYEWDRAHPIADESGIRALNPNMLFMAGGDARTLNYKGPDASRSPSWEAQNIGAIPTSWILKQVGSTLSAALSDSATSLSVVDGSKFRVNDLTICGDEKMFVDSVTGNTITVHRAMAGSIAVSHPSGAKVNPAATIFATKYQVVLDMTPNCPLGTATGEFATPMGRERAIDWEARRHIGFFHARNYDGIAIDNCGESLWRMFKDTTSGGVKYLRSIGTTADPNTPVADYVAWDKSWQDGIREFGALVRAGIGDAVLIGNANVSPDIFNGYAIEGNPTIGTSLSKWTTGYVAHDPTKNYNISAMEYGARAGRPGFTTDFVYGDPTDYKLMRFGLCSSLLTDTYFYYGADLKTLNWYDEYDNAGAGKGYLGLPTGAATQVGGAWRRDYAGGIALVNPTASAVTIQLGGSFTHIKGTQAPTVNNGTTVTSVTIPSCDGIILLRPVVAPPADTTAPVTTSDAKATYVSSAVVKLAATDNVGVSATYYTLDGGMQIAGTTINVTTAGSHMIQFWSVDAAGNVEVKESATFTITVPDTTTPVTTSDAKATYVSSAAIKLAATDNVGVSATYYTLDGGMQIAGTTINVTAAGSHTVQFWSVDAAGNVEVKKSATFIITVPAPVDTTAPVTTSDAKATYVSSAAVKLAATDNVGVTATYFTLDGGVQDSGTTINVTAAGSHTVQFWSVDAAGNVEVKESATFAITVPLPAGTMTIASGAARVTSPDVAIASSVSGAVDMRTDPGTGTFGSWMTYAPTTHVTLAGGYGTNLVRVEYRSVGGTLQLMASIDLIKVVTPVDPPVVPVDPPVVPVDPPVVPTQTVDPTHTVDPTQTVAPVVTLTASTTTLGYGSSGTLRIAVAPMSNMSVRIEQRTATNPQWTEVTTTATGLDGTVQLTVKPLLTTDYRTVLVDTGVVSNTVTVSVKALATVKSSKKTIHRKNSVTMSGKVMTSPSGTAALVGVASAYSAPAATKVSAVLQRNVHGRWITIKRVIVSASGSYHVHIRPLARRTYSYRIRVASSATNAVGVSRTIRIRVR